MELIASGVSLVDSEDRLHELAQRITGFDDFGAPGYLDALRVLLRSFDEDADLSEAGRTQSAGLVLTALMGRLCSEAAWKASPGYRQVALRAPIVILGLPRTGTSALHELLCCDPRNQGLELWLAQAPQPRPPRDAWEGEAGYQRCVASIDAQRRASPGMFAIHDMRPEAPDECWNLLRQDFASVTFECVARVRAYSAWWAACDMRAAYARWADNLRLIGMNEPQRRWILKDPSHLFALEALLEAVPDALLVMTHRDPAKSIPSVCSLNAEARANADRAPDASALGREQLELWARGIERTLAVRERHPGRFVDVAFRELLADPIAVVRSIYAGADARLSPDAEAAMRAWLGRHPPKAHRYRAADFGLSDHEIRDRFADYLDRCAVDRE